MPDKSETINNLKEAVQTASAALLLLTSVCFVSGLLIVNIHLAKFGIHFPTLNRSEYVLVGVIFVLLVATSHFAINVTLDWVKVAAGDAKQRAWRKFLKSSFQAFTAFLIPAFALTVFSGFTLTVFDWRTLLSIFMLGSFARYARQAAWHVASIWNQYLTGAPRSDEYHPFAHKFTALFEVVISVALVVGVYARFTFQHIESAYGGGLPPMVRIVPTKHGADVLSSLKIPISAAGDAGPFFVVSESDSEIVITSELPDWGRRTVTRLKKSLLDAVLTVNREVEPSETKTPAAVSPPTAPVATHPKPNTQPGASIAPAVPRSWPQGKEREKIGLSINATR